MLGLNLFNFSYKDLNAVLEDYYECIYYKHCRESLAIHGIDIQFDMANEHVGQVGFLVHGGHPSYGSNKVKDPLRYTNMELKGAIEDHYGYLCFGYNISCLMKTDSALKLSNSAIKSL